MANVTTAALVILCQPYSYTYSYLYSKKLQLNLNRLPGRTAIIDSDVKCERDSEIDHVLLIGEKTYQLIPEQRVYDGRQETEQKMRYKRQSVDNFGLCHRLLSNILADSRGARSAYKS